MLSCEYNMNDLKNRQYLAYSSIFKRVIISGLLKRNCNPNIIAETFENGNIYNALSKKSVFAGETINKNYARLALKILKTLASKALWRHM